MHYLSVAQPWVLAVGCRVKRVVTMMVTVMVVVVMPLVVGVVVVVVTAVVTAVVAKLWRHSRRAWRIQQTGVLGKLGKPLRCTKVGVRVCGCAGVGVTCVERVHARTYLLVTVYHGHTPNTATGGTVYVHTPQAGP